MSLSSDQFISSISHVDANSFKNEVERAYAKAEAAKLLARLETPWEKGLDIAWNQVSTRVPSFYSHLMPADHTLQSPR